MSHATAATLDGIQVAVCRLPFEDKATVDPVLADEDCEWVERLLQQNAVWFCQLRWMVVAGLGLASLGTYLQSRRNSPGWSVSAWWPLAAAVVLAGFNLIFSKLAHRTAALRSRPSVGCLLWAQIVSDLLVLTAVIHWLGPGFTAAPFMYLFHVILACIVFSPSRSLAVAALAAGLYLISLSLEAAGLLPGGSTLSSVPGATSATAWPAPTRLNVGSMLLIWTVIWYLVSRLASALRSRDRELYLAHRRLSASVEERSKHMLQTTHQLKAPFAAIHAQAQLLLGNYCGMLPEAARTVVQKISARCLVLAQQIQEMLQLANLRSQGQATPPRRTIHLDKFVQEAIARLEPAARERHIEFKTHFQPVTVQAVEDHLTMLLDNLLVNAVNYSYDHGVVEVSCLDQKNAGASLMVRDHGIGIVAEKLPRIFEDYYRTEEAVQHNRGSSGLGLAIVRQVAFEDGVPIVVESAPGWGTRFTVTLNERTRHTPPKQNAKQRDQDCCRITDINTRSFTSLN